MLTLRSEPLPPRTVSGKVIVELEPGSTIGARDGRSVDIHARFMEELDRRLPADSFRLRNKYNSAVFSGVALDLSSVDDIKTIAKTKGVKRVEPVRIIHQLPFKTAAAPDFKAAPDQFPPNIMTGVDKAHELGFTGKGIKIGMYAAVEASYVLVLILLLPCCPVLTLALTTTTPLSVVVLALDLRLLVVMTLLVGAFDPVYVPN